MDSRDPTPDMEEEELEFQPAPPRDYPLSPVIVIRNDPPVALPPQTVVRLPTPYPTFNASWPLTTVPQGPRGFIRSSLVFQPSTRQFRPISVVTTSPEPADGYISDMQIREPEVQIHEEATEVPPNQQVQFELFHRQSPPRGQPIPTLLSTNRIPDPMVTKASEYTHATSPVYSPPPRSHAFHRPPPGFREIISNNVQSAGDSNLQQQLLDLQLQNERLRQENDFHIQRLQSITEEMTQAFRKKMDRMDEEFKEKLANLAKQRPQSPPRYRQREPSPQPSSSGNTPTFTRPQRVFGKEEKLLGNKNFREWASAVITEFQVLGILETVTAEFAATAPWSSHIKLRADAMARSIITQAVSDFIKPQIRDLPSAFQMWTLLYSRYKTVSSFEPHKLVTEIERLTFTDAGSAIALIEKGIMIRDKHLALSGTLTEPYWSSAILRKLIPYYQLESQFLMTHPNITLEQVHVYFAERVFDSFEPGKANALYQNAAPSDAPPKPIITRNISNSNTYPSLRMYNKIPFLSSEIGSQQQRDQGAPSSQNKPPGYLPIEKGIPIRAFNPAVPILRGLRTPPPRGLPYSGSGPRAEGNRCIGCGMTGHSTYDCPYGNYPFCYRCKRFGHIRAECRDEWLADLPGDHPMPSPPVLPPNPPPSGRRQQPRVPVQNQQLAIEPPPTSDKNGNFVRLSCLSLQEPSENVFLLDTGASTHVVKDRAYLSNFTPYNESRQFFTAEGSSTITIQGKGEMIIRCMTRTFTIFLKLQNVLFAPDIPVNVISVSQLCAENRISILFINSAAIFYRSELINVSLSESVSRSKLHEESSENLSFASDNYNLSSQVVHTLNFSKPFFTIPKTKDNLYSFALPFFQCSFHNIPLDSCPIYAFNEFIPQDACQAVLLTEVQNGRDTPTPHSWDHSSSEKDSWVQDTKSEIGCYPLYRTKTGRSKQNPTSNPVPTTTTSPDQVLTLWHKRMAHAALPVLKQMLKIHLPNFKISSDFRLPFCDVCTRAKLTSKSFDTIRQLPTRPAEIIAADLIGPINPRTFPHGYRFVLTVIDIYSRFARVFLLKSKTETAHHLHTFFNMARAQHPTPGQMKYFRSDNGTEFTNRKVQDLIRQFGMQHQCSTPGVSPHNATIERFNRTIEEKTRALMLESGVPPGYWGLAIGTAEYVYNRTPHSSIDLQTPFQKWTGEEPNFRYLSIFGSVAYVLNANRTSGRKFQEVADLHFLVGYTDTGYILLDPKTKKTIQACSVRIDENRLYKHVFPPTDPSIRWSLQQSQSPSSEHLSELEEDEDVENTITGHQQEVPGNMVEQVQNIHPGNSNLQPRSQTKKRRYKVTIRDAPPTDEETDDMSSDSEESSDSETDTTSTQVSYRSIQLSDTFSSDESQSTQRADAIHIHEIPYQNKATPSSQTAQFLFTLRIPDPTNKQDIFEHPHPQAPKSFTEVQRRPDSQQWKTAMDDEIRSMEEFGVWSPVTKNDVPRGTNLLPWKWVYTYKENMKPKARLVIIGSSDRQKYSIDQTFSPVPPPYVIRWFFAYAHYHELTLYQIDIKTAFLHSVLPQTRFTHIPKGVSTDENTYALKLNKAAYGLAVSPLLWFKTFTSELLTLGFTQSIREPCLLYKTESDSCVYILVYVDDVLFAGTTPQSIQQVICKLEQKFRVKRLGFPQTYVGFQIDKNSDTGELTLHQREYARQLLDAFLPVNERGQREVPMNTFGNFPISASSNNPLPPSVPYKSVIGTLYYYANGTRPDILFAVNYLSRVQAAPTKLHWTLVQQLLRYVYTTQHLGLTFQSKGTDLTAFVDADFGSDISITKSSHKSNEETHPIPSDPDLKQICNRYKSTTGCIIQLYGNPIAWLCRKQPAITTSTTESEFVAVAEASTLIIFLRELTLEIHPSFPKTATIYEDNLSTTTLLRSLFHHGKLKHLALRVLRVKELIWNKLIQVLPIRTSDQVADILTKPLPKDLFAHLRTLILGGNQSSEQSRTGTQMGSLQSNENTS